jgi:hypothetical protein
MLLQSWRELKDHLDLMTDGELALPIPIEAATDVAGGYTAERIEFDYRPMPYLSIKIDCCE